MMLWKELFFSLLESENVNIPCSLACVWWEYLSSHPSPDHSSGPIVETWKEGSRLPATPAT